RHLEYARSVTARLTSASLRARLDERQEKIGFKIREAQLQKVPYMLVVGDRETADDTVSVRARSAGAMGAQSVAGFISAALLEIASKGAAPKNQESALAAEVR